MLEFGEEVVVGMVIVGCLVFVVFGVIFVFLGVVGLIIG